MPYFRLMKEKHENGAITMIDSDICVVVADEALDITIAKAKKDLRMLLRLKRDAQTNRYTEGYIKSELERLKIPFQVKPFVSKKC